ncbi:MAG: nucleotidyltransferase family protein, partial [Eubacterium sp.]
KGAVVNKYYPVKEFRTSGDIDVIIRNDNYQQVIDDFKSRKVKFADISDNTASVVTGGVNVEIHRGADADTPYFDNVFDMCSVKDKNTYILDDYEHLLYTICHLAKHLAYRGAGIRMLMDIDVMIRHIDNFNEDKLYNMSEKAGRLKTVQTLLSLCNLWFDTPVNDCVDIKNDISLQDAFETVLIDGGCFGYENNSVPANYIGEFDKNGNLPFSKKVNAIVKMAFPGAEYLRLAYPYAKKSKLLIPAAQINRLYDGLTKKSRQAKKSAKQVMAGSSVSKIQIDLLRELDIK